MTVAAGVTQTANSAALYPERASTCRERNATPSVIRYAVSTFGCSIEEPAVLRPASAMRP
jgi:hypothetical protein